MRLRDPLIILATLAALLLAPLTWGQTTRTATAILYDDGSRQDIPAPAPRPFTVHDGKILDGNGVEFIPRGINHMIFGKYTPSDLDAFKVAGANAVRCAFNPIYGEGMTPARRKAVADRLLALGIVPIVTDGFGTNTHPELQTTGSADPLPLRNAVQRWIDNRDWLGTDLRTCVNVANEWGPKPPSTVWRDEYVAAVPKLRAAGIGNLLVIDAPDWGQNPLALELWAKQVMAADPLPGRLIFSLHLYNRWYDAANAAGHARYPDSSWDIDTEFARLQSMGIPFIVGEFSWKRGTAQFPDMRAETISIMDICQRRKIGWLAWSWNGNGNSLADMWWANPPATQPVTSPPGMKDFGRMIVGDPQFGLKVTARRASVFGGK